MKAHPLRRLLFFIAENPLLVVLVVLVAVVQLVTGSLLSLGNLRGIGLDAAVIAIVAAPVAMLFIAGYLDFSMGGVLALSGVTAALLLRSGADPLVAVLGAIVVGALIGAVNATLTTIVGLSAFVTTLGMMIATRGFAQLIAPLPISGFPPGFAFLGIGNIAGIPVPIWIAAVVLILSAVFLNRAPAGRHVYAIGVSREAAFLSGLKVRAIPFALYVYTGAASGLAAVITIARLNSAPAGQIGQGFELSVITAVLLGGVSLMGGAGSIFGVLIGVLFMGVLRNSLVLLNVQNFWQDVASGIALIAAVGLAFLTNRLRQRVFALEARSAAADAESPQTESTAQNPTASDSVKA